WELEKAFECAWLKSRTLLDDLESRLEELRPGRHGVRKLPALTADARKRERPLESPLEVDFWIFRRERKLPRPLTGVQFDDGCTKRYRADFLFLNERVI